MQQGICQWELAQRAGISESLLSKIETGRVHPSHSVMVKLANAIGIPPYALQEPIDCIQTFEANLVARTPRNDIENGIRA